jgi:trehalose 6-phosphate phosphatase
MKRCVDFTKADDLLATHFAKLKSLKRGVLLLDYDGTLAPFVVDRLKAYADPDVHEALDQLVRTRRTDVAIISGRPVEEVRHLLGLSQPVELWGSHGREQLSVDGQLMRLPPTEKERSIMQAAAAKVKPLVEDDKLELKTGSIAVHWRGAEETKRVALEAAVRKAWEPFARDDGFELTEFDGGLELRLGGRNKGDVVNDILSRYTNGDLAVAYLGDDMTDEDAFAALRGKGLTVLVRSEPRETNAIVQLRSHRDVAHFLTRWIDAISG